MTDFEQELHKATSNDVGFPDERALLSIASQSRDPNNCRAAIKHIFKKLQSPKEKWRKVYKALTLIEVMLQKGNKMLKSELNSKLFVIGSLVNSYEHLESLNGKQGFLKSLC